MRSLLLVVALALTPIGGEAAALGQGELLVAQGDRLVRVDPDTGAYEQFSPPQGSLAPNLIDAGGTHDIVFDPSGEIFVTSGGKVLRIDPSSGEQNELRGQELVFIHGGQPLFLEGPLPIGDDPAALALGSLPSPPYERALYVTSVDRIDRVNRNGVNGEILTTPVFAGDFASATYLAIVEDDQDQLAALHLGFLDTVATYDAMADEMNNVVGPSPSELVGGLDFANGDFVLARHGFSCDAGAASVSTGLPPVPITSGGFLRCPVGLAVDPLDASRIWVTDSGDAPSGRKLIRVAHDGVAWVQTVHTPFAEADPLQAVAVSPVNYAPESGAAALGVAACAALVGIARRHGRTAATARCRSRA